MPVGFIGAAVGGSLLATALAGDPPDNSGAINKQTDASERVGMRQLDLAEKQYADQKTLTDKYAPLYEQQVKLSTEAQAKQSQQSDEQWASYKQFFAPTEQALATKALNYDTPERREAAANDAMGLSRTSFDASQRQLDDGLASAGVDPSSGAAMAQRRGLASAGAASTAAVGNAARTAVEDKGMAYLDNAARFGRNMPSTGLAAASAAQGSGNNATGTVGQQSNLITAQTQASQGLLSGANSSFGTAGNLQLGLQNSQLSAWKAKSDIAMDGAAAGMKAYSSASTAMLGAA